MVLQILETSIKQFKNMFLSSIDLGSKYVSQYLSVQLVLKHEGEWRITRTSGMTLKAFRAEYDVMYDWFRTKLREGLLYWNPPYTQRSTMMITCILISQVIVTNYEMSFPSRDPWYVSLYIVHKRKERKMIRNIDILRNLCHIASWGLPFRRRLQTHPRGRKEVIKGWS